MYKKISNPLIPETSGRALYVVQYGLWVWNFQFKESESKWSQMIQEHSKHGNFRNKKTTILPLYELLLSRNYVCRVDPIDCE